MINFETLCKEIEQASQITIFRHVHPAWDAIGAQLGLKTWIKEHYPDKAVYALGDPGTFVQYEAYFDQVDDEAIASSLAIVVDCGNAERVDDARFQQAKQIIKIDHHPQVEHYGTLELVNEKAGATCEIIANLFRCADIALSQTCASFLYQGLLMDTARFSIATTTKDSFLAAAYLCEAGIDLPKISEACIALKLTTYAYVSYLRSCMRVYKDKIAYAIMEQEDYEKMGLSFAQAKEFVYVFAHIEELSVWTLFTKEPNSDHYKGSLRSRSMQINDIASCYHGGGHALACGVSQLTKDSIMELLETLYIRLMNEA